MRLVGRRRHPLREIRSGDDATLARSGAGITEPLRLVSFGPFLKAFGTLSAREISSRLNLLAIQVN
jgi:hypothetical protein